MIPLELLVEQRGRPPPWGGVRVTLVTNRNIRRSRSRIPRSSSAHPAMAQNPRHRCPGSFLKSLPIYSQATCVAPILVAKRCARFPCSPSSIASQIFESKTAVPNAAQINFTCQTKIQLYSKSRRSRIDGSRSRQNPNKNSVTLEITPITHRRFQISSRKKSRSHLGLP